MIELRDLHKSFGRQKVLEGLNLHVPTGQITVIIGRSGEGKSVLIKHFMGLIRPDAGEVLVDGQNLLDLDEVGLNEMRKRFGMLFQNGALFDSMTVQENVEFPLVEHAHMTANQRRERVVELLDIVGLGAHVLSKYPAELSGGMRKRAALARAVALKPGIILYDEPTTGLDPVMTDVIDHLILDTQRKLGVTSVVISHDIHAVYAIADKIAMLHEGRILMEGSVAVFKESQNPVIKNFLEGRASPQQLASI